MAKSEYGKGLVVCLTQFYGHFENQQLIKIYHHKKFSDMSEENQRKIISDNPPDNFNFGREINEDYRFWITKIVPIYGSVKKAISAGITLWANGASDHLYEIEVPEGEDWNEIREIVSELKHRGLNMGHGGKLFGYILEDIERLRKLTEKALVLIDEKLGLKPDWGKF